MPVVSCSRWKDVNARRAERVLQAMESVQTKDLSQEGGEVVVVVEREQRALQLEEIIGQRRH